MLRRSPRFTSLGVAVTGTPLGYLHAITNSARPAGTVVAFVQGVTRRVAAFRFVNPSKRPRRRAPHRESPRCK